MQALAGYRRLFPVTERFIFFNHAGVSPISLKAAEVVHEFLIDYTRNGSVNSKLWERKTEEARKDFARLIGAEPGEVAFVKNTSEGISLVANGIGFEPGDNVVIPSLEFPANVYPWLNLARFGVATRIVPARKGRISVKDIDKAIDRRTRLVSISSVEYSNGFRNDLEALGSLCRKRDIYFCVDAIQSLGAIPMDVKRFGIDLLAADGHKWLLSPEGAGGFYCSKRVLSQIHPAKVGWKSVVRARDYSRIDFTLRRNSKKFEEGSLNLMTIAALGAELKLLLEVGLAAIEKMILSLTDHLIAGLRQQGFPIVSSLYPRERSGIVSFLSRDPEAVCQRLKHKGIIVSVRDGAVRVSPHFYNSHEEVDKLLEVLGKSRLN
ncbi:MAG: aminotransferase class V-fold PLP-dependent enzyme [Thermodesulfobacteriota bacterium]